MADVVQAKRSWYFTARCYQCSDVINIYVQDIVDACETAVDRCIDAHDPQIAHMLCEICDGLSIGRLEAGHA